jgi:hypothetical protein
VYAPNELSKRPKPVEIDKDLILIESLVKDLDNRACALLEAIILQESKGNPKAYNEKEDAVGILQIRPVKVAHINQILKRQGNELQFTLEDRWDARKSILMWKINMEVSNPNYDVLKACISWNGKGKDGNGSPEYYNNILTKYKKLCQTMNTEEVDAYYGSPLLSSL